MAKRDARHPWLTCALMFALGGTAPVTSSTATRNPLYAVAAGQFEGKQGDLTVVPATDETGPGLANGHAGDWVVYKAFDFDSGVAAFKANVTAADGGTIGVCLDRPDGPVFGTVKFGRGTRGRDVTCPVANGQAGVRDVYLVFGGPAGATVGVKSFVFLKSVDSKGAPPDLSARLDRADDGEPQATKAWGMPEAGFTDDFADFSNWTGTGFTVARGVATAKGDASAHTPRVYVNKTDTGGEWRTMAEAALTVDVTADAARRPPGGGVRLGRRQAVGLRRAQRRGRCATGLPPPG